MNIRDLEPDARFALARNRIKLELPYGASCATCGDSNVLHLAAGQDPMICQDCLARRDGRAEHEEHHLGGRPSPLSTVPVTPNDHKVLTLLQSAYRRPSDEPGSAYAVGFDVGALLATKLGAREVITTPLRRMRGSGIPKGVPAPHDPQRPIAVRTHAEPPGWHATSPPPRSTPDMSLLLVTEPQPTAGGPLWFGVWALVDHVSGRWLDSGIIHAECLADDEIGIAEAARRLGIRHVEGRGAFPDLVHRFVYQRRALFAPWDLGVDVGRLAIDWTQATRSVYRGGFSFIFATRPGEPTSRKPLLANGEIENGYRSRLTLRSIGPVRALAGLTRPGGLDARDRSGTRTVTSIRALAQALSGTDLPDIAEAAALWGVEPPSPLTGTSIFDRVTATADKLRAASGVYLGALASHKTLSPHRPPGAAVSPGTYAAAMFDQMGMMPRMVCQPDFDPTVLAGFMGAYFSGDVFPAVRGTDIPAVKLDFGGQYPVVYNLCEAWTMQAARAIRVYQRDPTATAAYLRRVARKIHRCLRSDSDRSPLTPRDWRRLTRTLVWVLPSGDVLPHRPQDTDDTGPGTIRMVIGSLTSSRPLPFILADVLRSLLDTGSVPDITHAVCLSPWGRQKLRTVTLPGGKRIDPTQQDPVFAAAIERARIATQTPSLSTRRTRGLLKGVVSSAASGLPVQILDDEPSKTSRTQLVWDPTRPDIAEPTEYQTDVIETPGRFYFPPIAAGVTAGARLLLHLTRMAFETAGGTVAYWDTDSLFIAATPLGGDLIPMPGGNQQTCDGLPAITTMSYADIHRIRWKIEAFSPYPPELRPYTYTWNDGLPYRVEMPGLLRWEPENDTPPDAYGLPVPQMHADINRSKRYRTYHTIEPGPHVEIHDGHGIVVEPTNTDRQELSRVVVTNPSRHGITYTKPDGAPQHWVEELFAAHIAERHHINQPVGDWAHTPATTSLPATRPEVTDMHPDLRPYSRISIATGLFGTRYIAAEGEITPNWIDSDTSDPVTLGTDNLNPIRNLDMALRRNTNATQPYALDPDGNPPGRNTRGILQPAPTSATSIRLIGKESRRWGDTRGILTPRKTTTYHTHTDPEQLIALIRKHYNRRGAPKHIAQLTGLPERTIRAILKGRTPAPRTRAALQHFAEQQRLF